MSEATIRKVWSKREDIRNRSALFEEAKKKTFRASVGRFTEVEDKLYLWIDGMRRANLLVPPSLTILKAKKIAKELLISQEHYGSSLADLENAVEYNSFFFTVKEQRWTEKILILLQLWISYMP